MVRIIFISIIWNFIRTNQRLWIGESIMTNNTPRFDIDFRAEYPTLTQHINGVDVELTDAEYEATIAAWEANQAEAAAAYAAATQKAADRAALLAQLGITEEQAKLLLG